jgi:hypothetical protein
MATLYCAAGCGASFPNGDPMHLGDAAVPPGWWQVHAHGEILAACSRRCGERLGGKPGTMFLPVAVPSCGGCYWFNVDERDGDGAPRAGRCGLRGPKESFPQKKALEVCESWAGDDHVIYKGAVHCEGRPVAGALTAKDVAERWQRDLARREMLESLRDAKVRCPACGEDIALNGSTVFPEHRRYEMVRTFGDASIAMLHAGDPRGTWTKREDKGRCPGSGRAVPMATTGVPPVRGPEHLGAGRNPCAEIVLSDGPDTAPPDRNISGEVISGPHPCPVIRTKLGYSPVRAGTLEIRASNAYGTLYARDDGQGRIVGDVSPGSSWINHETGDIRVEWGVAPAPAEARASYAYRFAVSEAPTPAFPIPLPVVRRDDGQGLKDAAARVAAVPRLPLVDLALGPDRTSVGMVIHEGAQRVRDGKLEVYLAGAWRAVESVQVVREAMAALEPDPDDRTDLEPGETVFHKVTGKRYVTVQPGALDTHEAVTLVKTAAAGWETETKALPVAVEDAWLVDDGSGPPYTRFPRALLTRRAPVAQTRAQEPASQPWYNTDRWALRLGCLIALAFAATPPLIALLCRYFGWRP